MAIDLSSASTAAHSGTPTFTAPEGTYRQSTVVLPLQELPLSGTSNIPSTINATNGALGITTTPNPPTNTNLPSNISPGNTSQDAINNANPSLQSAGSDIRSLPPITPSHNQYGISVLPLAWRKGAGATVQPSISACSVRWNSLNNVDSTTVPDTTLDSSQLSGSITAHTESSAGSTSTRRAASRRASNSHPNPPIEGVLVSQGIDPPVTSTTGGLGGMLGMAALTSYGFLPGANQLDLERQLSLMAAEPTTFTTPSSTYKPSKNVSKPKTALKQTGSQFVIRAQFHSELKEWLAQKEKQGLGPPTIVAQKGRTLLWLADAHGTKDPLARILFNSPPSAHDVNQLTRSSSTLDVIVGFPTGDILWIDLISQRYSRINKGGVVTPSGVTQIRWLPSATNEGLFITSHIDGTMLVWDRECLDGDVGKTWSPRPWRLALTDDEKGKLRHARPQSDPESLGQASPPSSSWSSRFLSGLASPTFGAHPSVVDWDPKRSIILTRPGVTEQPSESLGSQFFPSTSPQPHTFSSVGSPSTETPGSLASNPLDSQALSRGAGSQRRRERSGTLGAVSNSSGVGSGSGGAAPAGTPAGAASTACGAESSNGAADDGSSRWDKNPLAHWRVSREKINDFAISPDLGSLATVSDDGLLRIIDLSTQSLVASHASYFGAFLSCAWSPDGKFLLATSCDDLVSLYLAHDGSGYNLGRSRLLARCVGHDSSVKGVAWDPYRWKDSDRTYRFGSVGEDGKLCLWDFSSKSLGRPRGGGGGGAQAQAQAQHSGEPSGNGTTGRTSIQIHRHGEDLLEGTDAQSIDIHHASPSRKDIPQLQPVAVYQTYVPPSQPSGTTTNNTSATPNSSAPAAPLPGIPPGMGSQPATSPLLSVRFSPHAILLHHATGVLQTFLRPSRDGSSVSRLVEDGAAAAAAAATAAKGPDGSKKSMAVSTSMMGGLLGRRGAASNDDPATAGNKGGLSFGGTISRGMKWVGGGGGGGSNTASGDDANLAGTNSSSANSNSKTAATMGMSMF